MKRPPVWIACVKLLRVFGLIFSGYVTMRRHFPHLSQLQKEQRIQAWAKDMLAVLDIGLVVQGQPCPTGPMLLVANHISWLDILVMHAARYCRFVAKSDVHHWPVVGYMATQAGTLYVERTSARDALRVVHDMAQSLQAGQVLGVFPEGTTSNGLQLLPFHANLLQAAITVDAPVQPVALHFVDTASGQTSLAPCYIDDDTLMSSLWRTLTAPSITAVVRYGEPQTAQGRNRRQWAEDLRVDVGKMLASPAQTVPCPTS